VQPRLGELRLTRRSALPRRARPEIRAPEPVSRALNDRHSAIGQRQREHEGSRRRPEHQGRAAVLDREGGDGRATRPKFRSPTRSENREGRTGAGPAAERRRSSAAASQRAQRCKVKGADPPPPPPHRSRVKDEANGETDDKKVGTTGSLGRKESPARPTRAAITGAPRPSPRHGGAGSAQATPRAGRASRERRVPATSAVVAHPTLAQRASTPGERQELLA